MIRNRFRNRFRNRTRTRMITRMRARSRSISRGSISRGSNIRHQTIKPIWKRTTSVGHQTNAYSRSSLRNLRSPIRPPMFYKRSSYTLKPSAKNKRNVTKRGQKVNQGLPMPSGSFPEEHEMKGDYIPLVDSNVDSDYPIILRPTYVISIRPERFTNFVKRVRQWMIHCKRPPCVVGKTLDKNKLLKEGTINRQGATLKLGQIGCWLSHLKAWQCISNSPYEYGTVMEDDAFLGYDMQRVNKSMEELETKKIRWDVLFWCILPMPHVEKGLQPCGLTYWKRVPKNNCMGCIAYTVTKQVASMWSQKSKPIHNPVDVWVTQDFDNLQVYCISPILGYMVPTSSDTEDQLKPGYLKYI